MAKVAPHGGIDLGHGVEESQRAFLFIQRAEKKHAARLGRRVRRACAAARKSALQVVIDHLRLGAQLRRPGGPAPA